MNITADVDKTFDIAAAAQKLPPDARRLMAQADITVGAKKLSTAEVDAKLSAAGMPMMARLQLKISLERSGLLVD